MPTPALPTLLYYEDPTNPGLLSQKFGRETANYFSGSPLNRVSFLRGDRDFLRAAFSHPSTRFLLMKNLAPLVKMEDSAELGFVALEQVVGLTGEDPFEKSEEEQIKHYDSTKRQGPVILFLGIDDRGKLSGQAGEGELFTWKEFKGAAYFAVDVTPRPGPGGEEKDDAAESVIENVLKGDKFVFHESARHMGLHAGQGTHTHTTWVEKQRLTVNKRRYMAKRAPCWTGTLATLSAHSAASPRYLSTRGPNGSVHPLISPAVTLPSSGNRAPQGEPSRTSPSPEQTPP